MTASSSSGLKEEIIGALQKVGVVKLEPSILSQCAALATTMQLSATQIADCWDAVSLSHGLRALNEHSWTTLRQELVKLSDVVPEMTPSSAVQIIQRNDPSSPVATTTASSSSSSPSHRLSIVTPAAAKRPPTSLASSSSSTDSHHHYHRRISLSPKPPTFLQTEAARKKAKYEERQGAGATVSTFGCDAAPPLATSARPSAAPKAQIVWMEDYPSNVREPYRHMFTTVQHKAKALEAHLTEMSQLFQSQYSFGQGDLAPLHAVGVPSQELMCCVGRICSSAHEGRMNGTTVMLEGSRATSGGARIEVDVNHLKSDYSLFPGQIVAVEGHNTTGRRLVAQRLCEGAPHPPNESKAADLLRFHYSVQDGSPLKVVTAAGPFTTADNLDYKPLTDLFIYILSDQQENPVDVVILTGPFVDMRHAAVVSGQTIAEGKFVPLEVLFAEKVAKVLEEFVTRTAHATQFILQPCLDDATAEWVFPQAPMQDRSYGSKEPLHQLGIEDFDLASLGLAYVENVDRSKAGASSHRRIHCVPNPCTLRINELVFGLTSTDVLLHASTNETNGNLPAGSRLTRIAQHLMQQRSYYPLFPAPVNLDWQQREGWKMPCRPDILLCPSKLTPFAKPVLDSTSLVVNPGRLTRDTTGGTYAVLDIYPVPRETLESTDPNVSLAHNVAQRTRVEIKRV